ncbi:hypothetical protein [Halobacteriovorax sp.]|uniref:hypothetical protein n=1 Tax=Halobacteriovorax sp. TaxID=2020862 RepID=UPI0035633DC8
MKYLILSLLVAMLPLNSFADQKSNTAKKVVHLFDNATVGAVQTVIGATHILWYMIFDSDGALLKVHNNEETEVVQMGIENPPPFFSGAYSLGLFQVGGYAHDHEGGHSVASAVLGPLYLPTVGLSYLAEGHHASFVEGWAELESSGDGYTVMNDFTVSPGKIEIEGKDYNVVAFKYSLNEEQIAKGYGLESEKVYKWFNTNIMIPLIDKNSDIEAVPVVEFDLLKKELNLIVDNIYLYLGGDQDLKWQIKTSQEYLSYDNNKLLDIVRLKASSWQASYGLIYNLNEQIKFDVNAGVGVAYESMKFGSIDEEVRGFSLGTKFDFSVSFEDNYKMTYEYEKWTLGSNTSITEEFYGASYHKKRPLSFLHDSSELRLKIGKKEIEYSTNRYQFNEDRIDFGLELTF